MYQINLHSSICSPNSIQLKDKLNLNPFAQFKPSLIPIDNSLETKGEKVGMIAPS